MGDLDEAMMEHMAYIVFSERRPFCFLDFLRFEVDGEEYHMNHGTFRNKISALKKSGEIELDYKSNISFYTLRGHRFGKPMTPNHMVVNSINYDPIVRLIQNLPMNKNALHDIRLKFEVKGVWAALSSRYPEFHVNSVSKDIRLPIWNIDDLCIRVTVHKTNTVSVLVACSLAPVAADIYGIIQLSNALTRTEEKLSALLYDSRALNHLTNSIAVDKNRVNGQHGTLGIPDHKQWIVTSWHFSADSSIEYTGEKFAVTWEIGQSALVRAYTKIMKYKKTKIRLERQECPNKTFPEAIEEKLSTSRLGLL